MLSKPYSWAPKARSTRKDETATKARARPAMLKDCQNMEQIRCDGVDGQNHESSVERNHVAEKREVDVDSSNSRNGLATGKMQVRGCQVQDEVIQRSLTTVDTPFGTF